ncbi:hypothetical protein U0070_012005 [Myodes glareolus]|uniref:Dynein light chain n=1 Tax=Myodes glareolus TaxID=447135 RepID=A0AAW0HAV6_MYOGA
MGPWQISMGPNMANKGRKHSLAYKTLQLNQKVENLRGASTFLRSSQQPAGPCSTATMCDRKAALEKYNIEKDIAAHIKKEFDKKYNPTWHCIVGRNFGSYVAHETKHFIYFYLGRRSGEVSDTGELESWTTMWVLGLKPGSSANAARALNV